MRPVVLIHGPAGLSGTCYFEFLPGVYQDKCWNEESVFLTEEVFRLVMPIIARHEPQFDYYSFVRIDRPTWQPIVGELDLMARESGRGEVAKLAADLALWLRGQLTVHECVSLLGM